MSATPPAAWRGDRPRALGALDLSSNRRRRLPHDGVLSVPAPSVDAEPFVEKTYGDSFDDTNLETVLPALASASWSWSVRRPTRIGPRTRPPGASAPDHVIAHTNLYWTYQTAPGRTARTVETKGGEDKGR